MNLRDYPGLLPGLLITLIVATAMGPRLGRRLGVRPSIAWGLIAGVGLVISATLTPGSEAIVDGIRGSGSCDLSRMTLAPFRDLFEFDEIGLNVMLFVPLGVALGMLPRSRSKAWMILGAIAFPFVIEGTQLLVTPLGRACQSGDVIDNLTGLVLGLAAGTLIGIVMFRSPEDGPRGKSPTGL